MRGLHFCRTLHIAFLFLLFASAGCSMTAEELQSQIVKAFRTQPGEKMVASPDKTREQYPCSPRLGVILAVENVEAVPVAVLPGEEINHHLRYALCNPDLSSPVAGRITRTLLFRGATIFRDITPYEFKPGIWEVDAFIRVPAGAESGVYSIETVLEGGPKAVRRVCSFTVKQRVANK